MYNIYRVVDGDTLEEIANKFKTSVEDLMYANNMESDDLRATPELIVPDTNKKYFEYYTVEKGDSLYAIGRKYNINPELLASLNGLNYTDYIYPGQTVMIPKANYSYYITKDGDTLDSVANMLGETSDKLLRDNNIIYLLAGQLLVKENK